LAGCPPYLKIYVHNNSDNTIHVESRRAQNEVTTIRAGRAKAIPNSSLENVCFELRVGSDVRIYSIDPNSGPLADWIFTSKTTLCTFAPIPGSDWQFSSKHNALNDRFWPKAAIRLL
jgi:hypothetical protein